MTTIAGFMAQGFVPTLRQLYYQFVARDLIENKQTEYKRLGAIIKDGRRARLIDWSASEDRTQRPLLGVVGHTGRNHQNRIVQRVSRRWMRFRFHPALLTSDTRGLSKTSSREN
jgi:hypothetical protein